LPNTVNALAREQPASQVLGALTVSALGRWIYNVALPTYVYLHTHSPGWVAAVTFGRYVPALLVMFWVTAITTRVGEERALIGCDLVAMATSATVAGLMTADAGPAPIVILAAVGSVATRAKVPIGISFLAASVRENRLPLVAAAWRSTESVAMAVGPAVSAVLMATASPAVAVAVASGTFLVSVITVGRLSRRRQGPPLPAPTELPFSAWKRVARDSSARVLAGLGSLASVLLGVDTVLFAVIATHQLHSGTSGYALLFAGLGVGGLVGAATAERLVGTARPATFAVASLYVCSLPTLAFLALHQIVLAMVVQVVRGAASFTAETLSLAALQRSAPRGSLHQTNAVFTASVLAGLVVGATVAPILLQATGFRPTVVIAALVVPLPAVLSLRLVRRVDERVGVNAKQVHEYADVIRRLDIFDGADRLTVERLAAATVEVAAPVGTVIVRQGDVADAFYALTTGTVEVTAEESGTTSVLRRMSGPDYFGEIGILRGGTRTATVTAVDDVELLRFGADDFVSAVTGDLLTHGAVEDVADRRLMSTS
jgi:hypothetical protein